MARDPVKRKAWCDANRGRINGYVMAAYRRLRPERLRMAQDYLGGKCHDCPVTDRRVLQFDHVGEKTSKITDLLCCSLEVLMAELEKCELVCANCHAIRTYERGQLRMGRGRRAAV
jgi:hypothetical protein